MKTFKVGDKVNGYGSVGHVIFIDEDGYVGVEHDKYCAGFHNLNGRLVSGRGYWYNPASLDLLDIKQTFKGNK